MQITHLGHSCVLLETGSSRVLFDPGTFSAGFEDLRELDAVLITHQHADHVDVERLPALLQANPNARLVADTGSLDALAAKGIDPTVARPGDALELGDFAVNVVGGTHAVIHPDIPVVDNIGYVVDHGAFYHPGDAFHVPEQAIDVLALPTSAPWSKLSETVDFLRAVSPRAAVPIHEAVVSIPQMYYQNFDKLGPEGTTVEVLNRGEATTV